MNCPHCDAEVTPNSVFCQSCGERLDDQSEEQLDSPGPLADPGPLIKDQNPQNPSDATKGDEAMSDAGNPSGGEQYPVEPHPLPLGRRPRGPEEDVWADRFSPRAMYFTWFYTGLITIVAIVLGFMYSAGDYWRWIIYGLLILWVIQAGRMLYLRYHDKYILTTHKLYHKAGILLQRTDRIEAIDIDDITYSQGIIGRLLGVGTITIHSSDKSHPVFKMPGIDDVEQVVKKMEQVQRDERDARAAYVEQV